MSTFSPPLSEHTRDGSPYSFTALRNWPSTVAALLLADAQRNTGIQEYPSIDSTMDNYSSSGDNIWMCKGGNKTLPQIFPIRMLCKLKKRLSPCNTVSNETSSAVKNKGIFEDVRGVAVKLLIGSSPTVKA
ncbi:hypothetical protein ACROYT_G014966 [Oculina patagonica]